MEHRVGLEGLSFHSKECDAQIYPLFFVSSSFTLSDFMFQGLTGEDGLPGQMGPGVRAIRVL